MPITTRLVRYDITQFMGDEFPSGDAMLKLTPTANSVVEDQLIPAVPRVSFPDASGYGEINLVPGDGGNPQFDYIVTVLVRSPDGWPQQYYERDFGRIRVPSGSGTLDIGDLIVTGLPPADTSYWQAITEAQYDEIMQALADAEQAAADAATSAAAAALYDGKWFDSVSALQADTALTYSGSGAGRVDPGDYAQTRAEQFTYQVAASGVTDQHITTAGGVKLYRETRRNIAVTVGAGGDFATIGQALEYLDGHRRTFDRSAAVTATITLLTGFVLAEQVVARNGVDLSWITLTAADAVVYINPAAITTFHFSDIDEVGGAHAFYAIDRSKLPHIAAQFEYSSQQTASGKSGFMIAKSSSVTFEPGVSGLRRSNRGLSVLYGSEAYCYLTGLVPSSGIPDVRGADFSNCASRGIQAQHSSRVGMARTILDNCGGDNAVYAIWNCYMDLYQSRVRNSTSTNAAIHARDGSIIVARETDVSGAAAHGYHALHSARIDARYKSDSWAGAGGASNCGIHGVFASFGSHIDAQEMVATNCGSAAFRAIGSSTISAASSVGSGSVRGCWAEDAATISAGGATFNGCSLPLEALGGSTIGFAGGSATGATGAYAIQANASMIAAPGATVTGALGTAAVRAFQGGTVSFDTGNASGASGIGVSAERGGRVSAIQANCGSTGGFGFSVANGGHISKNSGTGTQNQVSLTATNAGLILG